MIHFENIKEIFQDTRLRCSDFIIDLESHDYDACQFTINNCIFQYRKSKITPKKEGQFVTFWKRTAKGPIAPFEENTALQYLIVSVESEVESGFFIFSKFILVEQQIIATFLKKGKRAFRIYPPWSTPKNKQATVSQKWQLRHFMSKKKLSDFLLTQLISTE